MPENKELAADFTLTEKMSLTLTEDNLLDNDEKVMEYLDDFGRTPLTIYSCKYCNKTSNKSSNVAFITGIQNENHPIEFVRLRYIPEKEGFVRDDMVEVYNHPEENLLSVVGYE
jgi:hypothetical protein